VVNLAPIDGLNLSPDNIFNYRIESALPNAVNAKVKGTVRFRSSPLFFSYEYSLTVFPGSNSINKQSVRPIWSFSSPALRELFLNYKRLPQGTYEYCVGITPSLMGSETPPDMTLSECLYQQSDDIFLINLIDPDNNAKIHEYNPVLSWVVNYPFASELTYRLRIAEIKDGQNIVSAITRNNPIYQEGNLRQTSQGYPVYAKPLILWQPYAWTVDAYYKDILLGGAEPWKFTIVDDSLLTTLPQETPFIDLKRETGNALLYVVGNIKLKYVLEDRRMDNLVLELSGKDGNPIKLKNQTLAAVYGDNRFEVNLKDDATLKHLADYNLKIRSETGEVYTVLFRYVNPELIN